MRQITNVLLGWLCLFLTLFGNPLSCQDQLSSIKRDALSSRPYAAEGLSLPNTGQKTRVLSAPSKEAFSLSSDSKNQGGSPLFLIPREVIRLLPAGIVFHAFWMRHFRTVLSVSCGNYRRKMIPKQLSFSIV